MRRSIDSEKSAVTNIADFMIAAARTAPKTRGIDNIEIVCVDDDATKKKLIDRMRNISAKEKRPSFGRDADSIAASPEIIVIGVRSNAAGLDCGFCGYKTCKEMTKAGGTCAYNPIDLGIAVSSAAGMASQFHVDNRVMYSIGRAAMDLGLFSKDVKQALGIPLSVTGKSPFFDRK